ncbi:serine hydrolase [Marinoscillum sp. MHG1-6]|uniref:serine hydrolase domain-containing protein n=1 Tax=Marinoscillum sp. MHG1-6 TaxID=2959627 RepID=UPI0021583EBC|nr:serine hydrolase [Marinoscillum sp. MHG1-6]
MIIFIAIFLPHWVWAGPTLSNKKADSLYLTMTPEEKARQLIWIMVDGNQDLAELSPNSISENGGIYLTRPFGAFDEYIFNRDFIPSLSLQLDHRLNPSPEELDNLPTLHTLASIGNEEILLEYFSFLKNLCKSYGVNRAVLPDGNETNPREAELIDLIHSFDPFFFIAKSDISLSRSKKKKHIRKVFDEHSFWAMSPSTLVDLESSIQKHARRIEFSGHQIDIKNALMQKYAPASDIHKRKLPNKLAVAISRESIIPIQKQAGVLPLKYDTICLITLRPFSPMAQMLEKYAYLITSKDGIQNSQAPIVIDNLDVDLKDYNTANRCIIFMGELSQGLQYDQQIDGALLTSTYNSMYEYELPQILMGAAGASGTMPTAAFNNYYNRPLLGTGRLGYAPAEMVGLDQESKERIQEIINEAINTGSTPGCQVAVAVDGTIVMEEGFGYLTYDSLIPTSNSTLYDLASVTKVSATLLAVMKLYEQGKIQLDESISRYLPEYEATNKASITLRQLLSHNAGLVSYVPFWKKTIGADRLEPFYYEDEEAEKNDTRSYGLKPTPALMDSLKNWIRLSPLTRFDSIPSYRYSDIGFMMLHQVVEAVAQQPMETFLDEHFYIPLGLNRLTFSPMEKNIDRYEIAPTEYDYYFRNEQVWGQVHDRNAAIFGGVAGHAGLFSNAHDLIIIMQMIAQGGRYGDKQVLLPETIDYFNQKYFEGNRRALGWDKKSYFSKNASQNASINSFGHTGFTGTLVWIDPEFDLVFVFLSNRIYPDANNYKLIRNDIRRRVQDVVYEAILSKWIN